jgi:multiple sugar transport system substrate-binding protein
MRSEDSDDPPRAVPAPPAPWRRPRLILAVVAIAVLVAIAVVAGVSRDRVPERRTVALPALPAGEKLVILSGRDPSGTRQKLVAKWNAGHPGIQVELHEIDVAWDAADQRAEFRKQIRDRSAAIVNIDVAYLPEFAAATNDRGLGLLAPLPARTPTDGFMQTPLDACRWNGELYCLPFNTDVGVVFSHLGAKAPGNWLDDKVSQGAVSLQLGGANEAFVVNLLENLLSIDATLLPERLAKGQHHRVNPAAWRDAVGRLRAAYWADRVRSAMTEEESVRAFNDGLVEYMRNWPSRADDVRGRVRLSPLKDVGMTAILGGQSLAVVDSPFTKKHLAQAAAVIADLTSEESAERLLLDGGFVPARTATYDRPAARDLPHTASLRQAVGGARSRPFVPGYGVVSDVLVQYIKPAILDKDPPPIDDAFVDDLEAALRW